MSEDDGDAPVSVETSTGTESGLIEAMKQAFKVFLKIPLIILGIFLLTGIIVYYLDNSNTILTNSLRNWISLHIFTTPETTASFLGTVAGGLITQISIVISMLLLVLQNMAGRMGNLIYTQFMKRRRNQVYVGYVIGSVMLTIFLRSTVSHDFNPVLGGTTVLVVVFFSMVLLAWFLYTVMNQMKPNMIIGDIHQSAIQAQKDEILKQSRTRRKSTSPAHVQVLLRSTRRGYVIEINLDELEACLRDRSSDTEVVIESTVGDYVAYQDIIARIRSPDLSEAEDVAECAGRAFTLGWEREPRYNLRFNMEQFEMMAWTEGSTAKHNPDTTLMVLNSLRDLLKRWNLGEGVEDDEIEELAVVYPDKASLSPFDALESIAVVSMESMQHQVLASVLDTLAHTYPHVSHVGQDRVDTLLQRLIPKMKIQVFTLILERSMDNMILVLKEQGRRETEEKLSHSLFKVKQQVGELE